MSGWTKYDTVRISWGAKQGPVYSNPSNDVRYVTSEQYTSGYNKKTISVFYRYRPSYSNYYSSRASGYYDGVNYTVYEEFRSDSYDIRPSGGNYKVYSPYGGGEGEWIWVYYSRDEQVEDRNSPIKSTRWYYQEPVYTYYFKKVQNDKESASYPSYNLLSSVSESNHPTGDYMSNVQEWVQYRTK